MNRLGVRPLLASICAALLVGACGGSGDDNPVDPGSRAPAAPDGLTATAASTSRIDLAWADHASDEDGFRIELAPGGTTAFTEIGTVAAGATTFASTDLIAATAYSYRIRAYNAVGSSAYSNTATATTKSQASPPTAPPAPSGLVATAASASQIDLSWTDNSTDEDGFRIEQAPGGSSTFTEIGTVAADATVFQGTGLNAGTPYSYRVRAYNAVGPSAYSNIATTTTQGTSNDLDGTWAIAPVLSSECGLWSVTLDGVTTAMGASPAMTFTLRGHVDPGDLLLEGATEVALGTGNTFAGSGTKTYPFGSFTFVINGQFSGTASFTADVQVTGGIQVQGPFPYQASCDPINTTVVGTRSGQPQVMSLLPASLTITNGASGILTVTIPANQPTPAEVSLSISPLIGILPASVVIPDGMHSGSFTVTGTGLGTATVTATLGTLSATSALSVDP